MAIIFRVTTVPTSVVTKEQAPAPAVPHTVEVDVSNSRGIIDALTLANPGDTIMVPPGDFLGPLILKDGVNIVAKVPRQSILHSDPTATARQGIGLIARSVRDASVTGISIAADDTHPLTTGALLADSSVTLENLEISGAVYSGVRIEGDSQARLIENFIHGNGGCRSLNR